MYNTDRFAYVCVKMDNKDYMLEQLIEDLVCWNKNRLFRVNKKDFVIFRGLVPIDDVYDLGTLVAASPFGAGYDVNVEGIDLFDFITKKKIRS